MRFLNFLALATLTTLVWQNVAMAQEPFHISRDNPAGEVPKFVGRFVFQDQFQLQGGTLEDVFLQESNEERWRLREKQGFQCSITGAYVYCSKDFRNDSDPEILNALRYQYQNFVVQADAEMQEARLISEQDGVRLYQRTQKWICDGVTADSISLSEYQGQWWLSVSSGVSSYSFDFKVGPSGQLYHLRKLHLRAGDLMKTIYVLVELSKKE